MQERSLPVQYKERSPTQVSEELKQGDVERRNDDLDSKPIRRDGFDVSKVYPDKLKQLRKRIKSIGL